MTDPVGAGLVASYARPAGNVTGLLITLDTMAGKLLELATEVLPGASRIGVLMNANNRSNAIQWRNAEAVAGKLPSFQLVAVEVRSREDLDGAFQILVRERVGGGSRTFGRHVCCCARDDCGIVNSEAACDGVRLPRTRRGRGIGQLRNQFA
jgi:hypothetical protein